jgi:hypothetical protein
MTIITTTITTTTTTTTTTMITTIERPSPSSPSSGSTGQPSSSVERVSTHPLTSAVSQSEESNIALVPPGFRTEMDRDQEDDATVVNTRKA